MKGYSLLPNVFMAPINILPNEHYRYFVQHFNGIS